jgi:hypothetical protein
MMGVVAACKFAVSAALLGFLLATACLIAEFGGSPLLALLAVLGIYGFPLQWGFIGFLASAPVGICFLVFAIRYFRRPSVSRGVMTPGKAGGFIFREPLKAAIRGR